MAFPHVLPVVPSPVFCLTPRPCQPRSQLAPSHSRSLMVTDGKAASDRPGLGPEMGVPRQ